jgi:hypothetical protein
MTKYRIVEKYCPVLGDHFIVEEKFLFFWTSFWEWHTFEHLDRAEQYLDTLKKYSLNLRKNQK